MAGHNRFTTCLKDNSRHFRGQAAVDFVTNRQTNIMKKPTNAEKFREVCQGVADVCFRDIAT